MFSWLKIQTHCSICKIHLRGGGIWCYTCASYTHVRCNGLPSRKEDHENFSCKSCQVERSAEPVLLPPSPEAASSQNISPTDFWSNIKPHHLKNLRKIHQQIVHLRPVFFTLSQNKTGFKFVEGMNIILSETVKAHERNEKAILAAMAMPHMMGLSQKPYPGGSILGSDVISIPFMMNPRRCKRGWVKPRPKKWINSKNLMNTWVTVNCPKRWDSPQNVYKSLTDSPQHKLTFLSRTTPKIDHILQETENHCEWIDTHSCQTLPYDSNHRNVKHGGLYIFAMKLYIVPPDERVDDYNRSKTVCAPVSHGDMSTVKIDQQLAINNIKKDKSLFIENRKNNTTENQLYSLELACRKGSSSWLNALPLKRYIFSLTKSELRDDIAFRYDWEPWNLPSKCGCGETFIVSHAMRCAKGGFTHVRQWNTWHFRETIGRNLFRCWNRADSSTSTRENILKEINEHWRWCPTRYLGIWTLVIALQ